MSRLIESPAAERQLLAAIAAQPEGAKLSVPRLRDALLNQADVLGALHRMVGDGRIDAQRLRPVKRPGLGAGHLSGDEPARPLFDALVAEARRRGLALEAVSLAIWDNKARIYALRDAGPTVRNVTADKVRAWIADKPAEAPAKREPAATLPRSPAPELAITIIPSGRKARPYCQQPGSCVAGIKGPCRICHAKPSTSPAVEALAPEKVTGASLAAEIDALIERTGANRGRVSNLLFDSGTGIERLREARRPKAETVEKVRLFLDHPPADLFAAPALSRRDPTQKPDTPLMDAADRQRLNGQRHHAANKRASESVAAKLVDAGADPSKQNSMVGSQMREIQRRRAEEARQADPVEQAKIALQRKGRSVYAADVAGGKAGHFHVSGKRDPSGRLLDLTPAALIAEAERVTGQTFRRAG
jgi:hypothetical protein